MRSIQHIIATLLLAVTMPTGSSAQFVTLEGRRFMLDGQEFYPVVLNYGTEYASNSVGETDPEQIFYSPMSQHGTSVGSHFECDSPVSCDQQLRTELEQIAAMGFNTIRLVGTNPRAFRTATGERPYKVSVHPAIQFAPNFHVDITASDFTDPLSERTFLLIEQILNAADDAGLKVILLTGTEVKTWPESEAPVNYDIVDRQNYAAYLHRLATALRDHPALLAYDILNEPAWRYTNRNLMDLTKAEVCEWTGVWYDALTTADPNHLVTLGGHSIHEIGTWDPAVMKIDFYSPHIYLEEDWGFAALYDMNVIKEKYLAELYWLGATLEMPWMVGETSFSADDSQTDFGSNDYLDALPEHHVMPYMNGNEAQQAAFVAETMAATRSYKGSGYSWWYYQNGRSFRYNQIGTNNITPKSIRNNYFGVLSFGHDQDPGRVKPMAAVVQAYQPEALTEELPEPPPAYWDWSNLQILSGSYTIRDQDDLGIHDALGMAVWEYVGPNEDNELVDRYAYLRSASNAIGYLPFHRPNAHIGQFERTGLFELWVDVSGGKRVSWGFGANPPWGSVIQRPTSTLPFTRQIGPLQVVNESTRKIHAWSNLSVQNVTISGSGYAAPVSIYARDQVQLMNEFHADSQSDVHISCNKTFVDCGESPYQLPQIPSTGQVAHKSRMRAQSVGQFEVQFDRPRNILHAWPNPINDAVLIQTDHAPAVLTVHDAQGRLITEVPLTSTSISLTTIHWPAGAYRLTCLGTNSIEGLTLIKTPTP